MIEDKEEDMEFVEEPRLEALLIRFCAHNRRIEDFPPGDQVWHYPELMSAPEKVAACWVIGRSRDKSGAVENAVVVQIPMPPIEDWEIWGAPFDVISFSEGFNHLIPKVTELTESEFRQLRTYQVARYHARARRGGGDR
jgi:hypothetical protein